MGPRARAGWICASIGASLLAMQPARSEAPVHIRLNGDFRLRLEDDWRNRQLSGVYRPERQRARIRARLGFVADLPEHLQIQGRLRTSPPGSQQSPNVTFHDFTGNPADVMKITMDRLSMTWKRGQSSIEAGRMSYPFIASNEMFWDLDVTPLGLVVNRATPLPGGARLRVIAGAFTLPVGLDHYVGGLAAGQMAIETKHLTIAAGFFRFMPDRGNPNRLLQLDGNGSRAYAIAALNASYRWRWGKVPVAATADLYRNLVDYSQAADAISRNNRDQRTGIVGGLAIGDIVKPRHLQIGVRQFWLQRFSVNSSFSNDDLARLGTASQFALSDLKGTDLYTNYQLAGHLTFGVRLMLAHRITTIEANRRIRIDLTRTF